jgi:hypothetical protein
MPDQNPLPWPTDAGEFQGNKIRLIFPIDSGGSILLLDPDVERRGTFRNILRIDQNGNVIWIADFPVLPDRYTSAEMGSDGLTAYSGGGYLVKLDRESGRILEWEFVK